MTDCWILFLQIFYDLFLGSIGNVEVEVCVGVSFIFLGTSTTSIDQRRTPTKLEKWEGATLECQVLQHHKHRPDGVPSSAVQDPQRSLISLSGRWTVLHARPPCIQRSAVTLILHPRGIHSPGTVDTLRLIFGCFRQITLSRRKAHTTPMFFCHI